ncbi:MAG: site-specific integrase [Bacteroidota bacterium]|nr:site-specific integrase [Bacteroidota bacterium]
MKITFRLKNKSRDFSYLFADISVNSFRLKYSIKLSVKSTFFDEKKQRLNSEAPEAEEINVLLIKYEGDIGRLIRNINEDGSLSRENLKIELDKLFRKSYSQDFLTDYIKFIITSSKITKKPRTVLHYQTTLHKILQYEARFKQKLSFKGIDYHFYTAFLHFCKHDLLLAPNTIGGHIKNIKTFMNIGIENGITDNLVFNGKLFKKPSEDVETVYLSEEELTKLSETSYSSIKLEKVRDIFLLGCYTGLRISDYNKISHSNLLPNSTILKVITEKTQEEVYIPLNKNAVNLLQKYNGKIEVISHQKFNVYLKEVCRIAGINEIINVTKTKGNTKITYSLPKHEIITSHCARRSFATNAFKAGVPSISIMKITGHRTEKSFLRYIRITKEENAKLISEHEFFK